MAGLRDAVAALMQQIAMNNAQQTEAAITQRGAPAQGVMGQNYGASLFQRSVRPGDPYAPAYGIALQQEAQREAEAIAEAQSIAAKQAMDLKRMELLYDYRKAVDPALMSAVDSPFAGQYQLGPDGTYQEDPATVAAYNAFEQQRRGGENLNTVSGGLKSLSEADFRPRTADVEAWLANVLNPQDRPSIREDIPPSLEATLQNNLDLARLRGEYGLSEAQIRGADGPTLQVVRDASGQIVGITTTYKNGIGPSVEDVVKDNQIGPWGQTQSRQQSRIQQRMTERNQ